jgi:hypothetical protein
VERPLFKPDEIISVVLRNVQERRIGCFTDGRAPSLARPLALTPIETKFRALSLP